MAYCQALFRGRFDFRLFSSADNALSGNQAKPFEVERFKHSHEYFNFLCCWLHGAALIFRSHNSFMRSAQAVCHSKAHSMCAATLHVPGADYMPRGAQPKLEQWQTLPIFEQCCPIQVKRDPADTEQTKRHPLAFVAQWAGISFL